MAFEQETDTIRRLQIAIRNSDMELLKEASYKLHEKFHEGGKFEMLQELNQILAYVVESDIPSDIKEILCPTIEEILDKETSPNTLDKENMELSQNIQDEMLPPDEPSIYHEDKNVDIIEEDENPQINIMSAPIEMEDENNELSDIIDELASDEPEASVAYDKPIEIYEPTNFNKQNDIEKVAMQETIETYQKQFISSNDYSKTSAYLDVESTEVPSEIKEEYQDEEENLSVVEEVQEQIEVQEEPTEVPYERIEEDASQYNEIKDEPIEKPISIFYYDKKSSPLPGSNQIDELSDVLDIVDTDIYDFEKLLMAFKGKDIPPYVVTTSQSIKLSEFLTQENISFKIPFVPNTTVQNPDYEIIPMWGLSNIFKCQKCGSKILSYSFNNKVLSVKCSSCSGVMYPEMYSENNNINPYYWQRAFGALASTSEWILLNLPQDNAIIRDFIETVYKSAKPDKIYLYPANNYYEEFFAKNNPNCEIISYQTQEKMLIDFGYFSNTPQVSE